MSSLSDSWRPLVEVASFPLLAVCASHPIPQPLAVTPSSLSPAAMSQSPFASAPSWQPSVYQVGFITNKHNISLAGQQTITDVAAVIEGDNTAFVTIVGRADIAGSANYNSQLSKRRATAVHSALIATGKIAPHQILTAWTGDEMQSLGIFEGLAQNQDRAVGICIS